MMKFGHIVISIEEGDDTDDLSVQLTYSGEADFEQEGTKELFNQLLNKIDLAIQETFESQEPQS